jgi:KUP system potassium uptake protein
MKFFRELFTDNFILGFKVDRLINDYFQQVLTDMVDEGIIPDRSSHPSLRAHNIPPDLKYIIIDNVYINDYLLTIREKIIMNIYNFVRKMGSNDFTAFGLVSHNVVVESAPLLYNPVRVHKIKQVGFNRFDED